ncbi:MAG TPA: hypothetical protein VHJ59_03395 [Nitrososphaera sp.]|nr:hypothetical protein [Nitrososphaera sp.]
MSKKQEVNPTNALKLIAIALSIYIIWVAATYILEGRIHLFQKVDPIGRITYVVIANIAIGTVLSTIAIRYLVKAQLVKPEQLGLNKSRLKTAAIIASAAAGGLVLFMLQNPRTTEPIVVFNAFMQVLPVSIAEVMVCWALIGSSLESLAKNNNKGRIVLSVIVGAVAASVLFGVYHYAHSPPFNQTSVVLFLMFPSIATAVTFFLGRDIYAAVIVQNFMGIVGVLAGLPNLEVYRQPMVPIYALSAVSVAALVISLSMTLKKTEKWIQNSSEQRVVSKKDRITGENGVAL